MPIIPMVLVNGCQGIGTGWSTSIPNFNPRDICEAIKRRLQGNDF
jgi:DNA topoisomerase-2